MSSLRWSDEQFAAWKARQGIIKTVTELGSPDVAPLPVRTVGLELRTPKFRSKAEARYADILEGQRRNGQIQKWRHEAITLKLADGVRFTPDFLVDENDGRMTLIEVKGEYIRDDARIKLRVAVEMYPGFRWFLVIAKRGGAWDVQRLS